MRRPHGEREKGCYPSSAGLQGCGTLVRGMASPDRVSQREHVRIRVSLDGTGKSNVGTGLPVLDHLLGLVARYGSLDIELQLAPETGEAEVAAAGKALGEALREPLMDEDVRGHGSAVAAADDALAHIVLEASGRPLVVSNVDLSEARVGGLGTDLVASFLHELAEGGGLTLHVRLIDGDDPQHVLEAIFKALGVALAQAGRQRKRKE
jgi:imidazoleglycerol-phosphate dehydratase